MVFGLRICLKLKSFISLSFCTEHFRFSYPANVWANNSLFVTSYCWQFFFWPLIEQSIVPSSHISSPYWYWLLHKKRTGTKNLTLLQISRLTKWLWTLWTTAAIDFIGISKLWIFSLLFPEISLSLLILIYSYFLRNCRRQNSNGIGNSSQKFQQNKFSIRKWKKMNVQKKIGWMDCIIV